MALALVGRLAMIGESPRTAAEGSGEMSKKMQVSDVRRSVLEAQIRDCYIASVDSHVADGAPAKQAHESAWRNLIDTFPRVSTGDLAGVVNDLV